MALQDPARWQVDALRATPGAKEPGALASLPWGLLAWVLGVVLWLTWAPFEMRAEPPHFELGLRQRSSLLALNLALLMPIGVVVALFSSGSAARRVALAALAALLISACIETGQMFVHGRNVTFGDLLFNTSGAALAALASVWLARSAGRTIVLSAVGVLLLAGLWFHMAFTSASIGRAIALVDWDPAYAVLAGDELGANRRYIGQVVEPAMCTPSPRGTCLEPFAALETREGFVREALEAQELWLSALVLSETDDQAAEWDQGPARIVTFSDGADARNATLGQERRDLVLRLRTRAAGVNGTRLTWFLPDAVAAGRPTRVGASYRGGVVTLYAESEGFERRGSFHPGLLQGWRLSGHVYSGALRPLVAPQSHWRHVPVGRADGRTAFAAAAVLFLPLGLAFGWFLRRPRLLAFVAAAATGAALLWILDAILVGGAPPALHLAAVAIVSGSGSVLGRRDAPKLARAPGTSNREMVIERGIEA